MKIVIDLFQMFATRRHSAMMCLFTAIFCLNGVDGLSTICGQSPAPSGVPATADDRESQEAESVDQNASASEQQPLGNSQAEENPEPATNKSDGNVAEDRPEASSDDAGMDSESQADESGAQADPSEPESAKIPDFNSLARQIENNNRQINRLYASITVGFPEKQRAIMSKIEELKNTNKNLKAVIDQSAWESFKAAPEQNFAAAQHLFDLMSAKINGQSDNPTFDPKDALKIGNLLVENGVNGPPVLYQGFRSSFALQEFEQAESFIQQIEATGVKLKEGMREHLEVARERWQRELELRQREKEADDLPRVKLETSEGDIVIELFEDQAPQTVANFISLVEKNFYNDLTFHDVRPGQFAQAGSPTADGMGDAGYYIPNETEREDIRHFFTGSVGMFHQGKDTGGSQFFITHQPIQAYDGVFTCFGWVIEGMDVVFRLHLARPENPDSPVRVESRREPPSIIQRATVLRKRDHEYKPTRLDKPADPNSIFGSSFRPSTVP